MHGAQDRRSRDSGHDADAHCLCGLIHIAHWPFPSQDGWLDGPFGTFTEQILLA
jgi:hypothetical protein